MKKQLLPLVLLAGSMMLAACDTTPPSMTALMSQITQACQAHDKQSLRADYAKEGVTAEQIDQQLGSWDAYLVPGQGWTYTGITYVSLADAANNKNILPDMITEAQGTMIGGMKFAPNIKVTGFILVSFKQPDGSQGGQTEDVGIDSDGTAKFALIEPQH